MVADREQVELPDSVGGAVGGMAAESGRLDDERADLMRDADLQRSVHAWLAGERQFVRGGSLGKPLEPPAAGHAGGGSGTHRRDRIGKRRNPADVIPVRVGDENLRHPYAQRRSACADPRHLVGRDAGIDDNRLISGDQQQ